MNIKLMAPPHQTQTYTLSHKATIAPVLYIKDPAKCEFLFDAVKTIPCIKLIQTEE